jgi:heme/copper-type cytochrome/quinol oxidase subunit 3
MSEVNSAVPVHEQPIGTMGLDNRKLGIWLFLATEVMLFSALIAGFLDMRSRSPAGANHVLNIPLTAFNTWVLICSSLMVALSVAAIEQGKTKRLRNYLLLTLLFGGTFLSIQIFEYIHLISSGELTPWGSLFGAGFYTVTSVHGLHVFIGLIWCTLTIIWAMQGKFSSKEYMRVEVFGLYWHFVDIVWIILFTIIYLL